MSKLICVTNRHLCRDDLLTRLEEVVQTKPEAILLREKDLPPEEYATLAAKVMALCAAHDIPCILHNFTAVARSLHAPALHLPLPLLREMSEEDKCCFTRLGSSCHSVEDALEAEKLGCTYIFAGHIFETDCKQGLPGRGLPFLKAVCASVKIPVFAIGGINAENYPAVIEAGAAGACLMSSYMAPHHP